MSSNEVALIGLKSPGLARLAAELGIDHVESPEIRRIVDNLDKPYEFSPDWILRELSGLNTGKPPRRMLLLYHVPWTFLGERIRKSGGAHRPAHMQVFAGRVLEFWQAYHSALLQLHRRHGRISVLMNGDRITAAESVIGLAAERLGVQIPLPGPERPAQSGDGVTNRDHALIATIDALAPECLELYAAMESCAALMGREPELTLEASLAAEGRTAVMPEGAPGARSAGARGQTEDGLYLLQLCQLQDELKRQFHLAQEKDRKIAELSRQLELHAQPFTKKIGRKLSGSGRDLQGWIGGAGRALKRQAATIRASGLFDEKWYLQHYADVAHGKIDAVEHYLKFGAAEGRNPGPGFDTQWYVETYPDVAAGGVNPLLHFIQFGRAEGRQPARPDHRS